MNKLSVAYTAGDTSLTFQYTMAGIVPGAQLSIGLNNFYVWAVSGQTATVSGGFRGSTDANASIGAVVQVSPRFSDFDIWAALGMEIADLSSPINGLYGIATVDFSYNAARIGYDLGSISSSILDGYEVKYMTPGEFKDTVRMAKIKWSVNRNSPVFASGLSLELNEGAYPGYTVRFTYKSRLVMPTSLSSDLSTSLLQPSAYDIPPLGAAIRLMAGREIKRNFTESQGDTRRATEVPPGAVMQSANGLRQLRASRIIAEAASLDSLYPPYRS